MIYSVLLKHLIYFVWNFHINFKLSLTLFNNTTLFISTNIKITKFLHSKYDFFLCEVMEFFDKFRF